MKQPLAIAYGAGADSTAMLVGLKALGIRPDLILFADVGSEKDETYAYLPIMNGWLRKVGFPEVVTVRNVVKNFKHWPPYHSLLENCLTNGTLPSLAFGFKSCSIKWKQAPQEKYIKTWTPAVEAWAAGLRVKKAIGYDCGPKDIRRRNHVGDVADPKYEFWYPLIEWKWDRPRCEVEIAAAGLPVPLKSSCSFCPAMKMHEVAALPAHKLREIVVMEARALPRLLKYAEEKGWPRGVGVPIVEGLWRRSRKTTGQPGSMTEFIRREKLLPEAEIDRLWNVVPQELIDDQKAFANGAKIATWPEFFKELEHGTNPVQAG